MARKPHNRRSLPSLLAATLACAVVAHLGRSSAQEVGLEIARDRRGAPVIETSRLDGSPVRVVGETNSRPDQVDAIDLDDGPPELPPAIARRAARPKEAASLKPVLNDEPARPDVLVRPAQHVAVAEETETNEKKTSSADGDSKAQTSKRPAKSLPLAKRSERGAENDRAPRAPVERSLIQMGGSLAIVCGLVVFMGLLFRRTNAPGTGPLPLEVIETLGRATLVKGQHLQLVRVGGKLLLLCVTAGGSETLTEIVDPDEVERLSTLCRQNHPKSVSAAFRDVLANLGGQPTSRGFVAPEETDDGAAAGRASWWQSQYRQGTPHA